MTSEGRTPGRVRAVDLDELGAGDEIEQSGFWGHYKARFGARPYGFRMGGQGRLLVLVRSIAPGLSLGYAPYGPDVPEPPPDDREEYLLALAEAVRPNLPRSVAFLRFDLGWGAVGGPPVPLRAGSRLRPSGLEIQPKHTVVLDLTSSDVDLLRAMHPKTRYNIGLSARRGVTVHTGVGEDLGAWYGIKVENDRRDGIVTHSHAYFQALFGTTAVSAREPIVRLLLARVQDRIVGGIIVSVCGRGARYLHGASSNEARNTMYTYALQWEAIRMARLQGATTYDLYGIPPDADPGHPMHGLYRFKTGFGGAVLHRLGCHDVVWNRAAYAVLRLPERARYIYYKKIRRRLKPARQPGIASSP